jgi:ankyrin repeat protein
MLYDYISTKQWHYDYNTERQSFKQFIKCNPSLKEIKEYLISNNIKNVYSDYIISLPLDNNVQSSINKNIKMVNKRKGNNNRSKEQKMETTTEQKKNIKMVQKDYNIQKKKYLLDKDYDNLLVCNQFDIFDLNFSLYNQYPNDIIKHIIDHIPDLEIGENICGNKPIHLICKLGSDDLIKYIVDKNVNIKSTTNIGETGFHIACSYSSYDSIMYILNRINYSEYIGLSSNCISLLSSNKKLTISQGNNIVSQLSQNVIRHEIEGN